MWVWVGDSKAEASRSARDVQAAPILKFNDTYRFHSRSYLPSVSVLSTYLPTYLYLSKPKS